MEMCEKMDCSSDEDLYDFNHQRRGIAIIIINENDFVGGSELRKGASLDKDLLQKMFASLGFEIRTFFDLPARDLLKQLHSISKEDLANTDCLAIAISTHGGEVYTRGKVREDTISTKDADIQTSLILDMFSDKKCPALVGKPRLVFIQACRGQQLDSGQEVTLQKADGEEGASGGGDDKTDAFPFKVKSHAETETSDRQESNTASQIQLNLNYVYPLMRDVITAPAPCFKDFLVMYATPPGFYAFRRPKTGSWFIKCLSDVLTNPQGPVNLMGRLTKVSANVARRTSSAKQPQYDDKKQTPVIYSMLTKDIVLVPRDKMKVS